MDLTEIAAIAGKGGLFKIIKPTRTGLILESIDEKRQKLVASIHHKVSVLDEISIYAHNKDGSVPLMEIFKKIYKEFGDDTGIDSKASGEELKSFMQFILPDYDEEKVYISDIKKLVSWYHVLVSNFPELFKSTPDKEKEEPKEGDE